MQNTSSARLWYVFTVAMKMSCQRCIYVVALFLLILATYAVYEILSEKTPTVSTRRNDANSCGAKPCDDVKPLKGVDDIALNVIITFVNAKNNVKLQATFGVTVESLLRLATRHVTLYLIGDNESQNVAQKILEEKVSDSTKYTVSDTYNIEDIFLYRLRF